MAKTAAIVLAGGAASRLGGVNKVALTGPDERTVLARALAACGDAAPIVVVGPQSVVQAALPPGADVSITCEEPAGSGPARAVAAGVAALAGGTPPDEVVVLAGDLPGAATAVVMLRAAWADQGRDGAIAVASGRRQWLLGVYRFAALARACAALPPQGGSESMRFLLGALELAEVQIPDAAAADLDTWADVERAGFAVATSDGAG